MLVRWPAGGVAGGSKLEVPTSQMDVMPTLLEVVGSKSKGLELDGVSVLNHLKGKDEKPPHEFMFHHCTMCILSSTMALWSKWPCISYRAILCSPCSRHRAIIMPL